MAPSADLPGCSPALGTVETAANSSLHGAVMVDDMAHEASDDRIDCHPHMACLLQGHSGQARWLWQPSALCPNKGPWTTAEHQTAHLLSRL